MKKGVKIFWWVFFSGLLLGILLIVSANIGLLGKMPSIKELSNPTALIASQVYAEDGTLMGKYLIEDRIDVEYKDISQEVIKALIATEDERFREHNGIDPRSLLRSLASFGTSGAPVPLPCKQPKTFSPKGGTQIILLFVAFKK